VLDFSNKQTRYSAPGRPDTLCHFNKATTNWDCDDGTSSIMMLMGLPFLGVISAEFDGRQFTKPIEPQVDPKP
jgi:hypothetical protein